MEVREIKESNKLKKIQEEKSSQKMLMTEP